MVDTTPQILQRQFDVYQAKSLEDKLSMLADMMEYGVNQTMDVLKKWYPDKSKIELKVEFFRLYYRNDFSQIEMTQILEKIRNQKLSV